MDHLRKGIKRCFGEINLHPSTHFKCLFELSWHVDYINPFTLKHRNTPMASSPTLPLFLSCWSAAKKDLVVCDMITSYNLCRQPGNHGQ